MHGASSAAGQIGVAEHVVVEAILGEKIGLEVAVVVQPVVGELLRAEHQDGFVAQLVVLDDRQRGEGFAQAHAVGQDATTVGLKLVDQAGSRVALEVEQLLPDQAVLVTGAVVGQYIFVHVFQELTEDVVEHQEGDPLRCILLVDRRYVVAEPRGYILKLLRVAPDLLEQTEEHASVGRLIETRDDVRERVAFLVTKVDSGKPLNRHKDGVTRRCARTYKGLHRSLATVGAERGFAAYPVSTLFGDSLLRELILQLDFKFAARQAALALSLGDMELTLLFFDLVAGLVGHKGWRGEDEFKGVDALQFPLQRHVGVDRKARSGDLQLRARLERTFEIFTKQGVDVVDQFHEASSLVRAGWIIPNQRENDVSGAAGTTPDEYPMAASQSAQEFLLSMRSVRPEKRSVELSLEGAFQPPLTIKDIWFNR